jgi:hypothetical protein
MAANNKQDDLAAIAGFLPYRRDDFANTCSQAAMLSSASTKKASGVIERTGDVDTFGFVVQPGTVITVTVALAPGSPNLDARATLLDASCTALVTFNPPTALTVPASKYTVRGGGTYYVQVAGTGLGDPLTTGYTSYASVGGYTVTVALTAAPTTTTVRPTTTGRLSTSASRKTSMTVSSSTKSTRVSSSTTALPLTVAIPPTSWSAGTSLSSVVS